jgi:hypothetical protein
MATRTRDLKKFQEGNKPEPLAEEQPSPNGAASQAEPRPDPCQRCNHAPVQHVEGPCQVLECDCPFFVYPPDVEDDGQQRIPGAEFERTEAEKELGPLIASYKQARDNRMQNTKVEVEARDLLIAAMKKRNLTFFIYHGQTCELVTNEKVKVTANGEGTLELEE